MTESFIGVFTTDLAIAALVGAFSGIIHGYTGFGAALVMAPLLSIIFGPVEAVAVTVIAALLATVHIYPSAARQALWREVGPLCIAILVATPLGVAILVSADPEWIRRAIGVFVLAAALLIMSGWSYRGRRGLLASGIAGALCGGITGAAGVGGPPVAVYFLAAAQPVEIQRANIIISIGVVGAVTLIALAVGGGVGSETVVRGIVMAPLYLAGFWTGCRLFAVAPAELYRKVALWLLVATGLSAIVV
jgi:uncharacterized membrane protein YfcA